MRVRVVVAMDPVEKGALLSGSWQYGYYSSRGGQDEHVVQFWCTFGARHRGKEKSWACLNRLIHSGVDRAERLKGNLVS